MKTNKLPRDYVHARSWKLQVSQLLSSYVVYFLHFSYYTGIGYIQILRTYVLHDVSYICDIPHFSCEVSLLYK